MRPFTSQEIRGTYATLLLPIREDDSIDFDLLQEQLNRLVGSGVNGIYSNGTAGEFYSLSPAEFDRVSRLMADTCTRAGMPYQIGAAWPTPQQALQRIAAAAVFAPSAIQVTLPDWWPPTLDESIRFLARAANAAKSVPLVLYNPPHAKRVLTPAELLSIVDAVPQIVGIKTGAGDEAWYRGALRLLQRVSVFVPGHMLATGTLLGAAGSYSNVACLNPRGAVRWNQQMHSEPQVALKIEGEIQAFLREFILPLRDKSGYSNMALDKLLCLIGDWCSMPARLRWPYLAVPLSGVEHLRRIARKRMKGLFTAPAAIT